MSELDLRDMYMDTYSGKRFFPMWPSAEAIDIEDIAHALAHICRFGGHSKVFYSVAQHSELVSRIVPPPFALAGLLHDASEAYLGDMIRPLKLKMPEYREVEKRWEAVIYESFGLPAENAHRDGFIKAADNHMLACEAKQLTHLAGEGWEVCKYDYGFDFVRIEPLMPEEAEALFLERFEELIGVA